MRSQRSASLSQPKHIQQQQQQHSYRLGYILKRIGVLVEAGDEVHDDRLQHRGATRRRREKDSSGTHTTNQRDRARRGERPLKSESAGAMCMRTPMLRSDKRGAGLLWPLICPNFVGLSLCRFVAFHRCSCIQSLSPHVGAIDLILSFLSFLCSLSGTAAAS